MRSLIIGIAALGVAASASAATHGDIQSNACPIFMDTRYSLDAAGQCRDEKGQRAPAARCVATQTPPTQCTDAKTGKPERCTSGQHFPRPPPPPPG